MKARVFGLVLLLASVAQGQFNFDLGGLFRSMPSMSLLSPRVFGNPFRLHMLSSMVDGAKNFLACFRTDRNWTDPHLGRVDLDPENYCPSICWRQIPHVSCCMPMSPQEMDVKFRFFEPNSSRKPRILSWDQVNFETAPSGDKVMILVHGFFENPETSPYVERIRTVYLAMGYTVIVLDWRGGNQLYYFQGFSNVRTLSLMLAKVLSNWNIGSKLRLVGFSLGAHIIGQAARMTKAIGLDTVKECHGLDPAGPFFTDCPQFALQKDDCDLTEAIHTSAEPIKNLGALTANFGTQMKIGHCDYWVNCGFSQGFFCTNLRLDELALSIGPLMSMRDAEFAKWSGQKICAHLRGAMVYVAALERKCNFTVHECPDCGQGMTCSPGKVVQGSSLPPFGACSSDMDVNYYIKSGSISPHCETDVGFTL